MPGQKIFNRKPLKGFRQELRNNLTSAEAVLWTVMQKSKLDGKKFRRQHSIGKYIVDFYCPSEKLAIELDGAEHFTIQGEAHDIERDKYISSFNIKILRYENKDVFNNLEAVLEEIRNSFKKPPRPSGTPP